MHLDKQDVSSEWENTHRRLSAEMWVREEVFYMSYTLYIVCLGIKKVSQWRASLLIDLSSPKLQTAPLTCKITEYISKILMFTVYRDEKTVNWLKCKKNKISFVSTFRLQGQPYKH